MTTAEAEQRLRVCGVRYNVCADRSGIRVYGWYGRGWMCDPESESWYQILPAMGDNEGRGIDALIEEAGDSGPLSAYER